MNRFERQRGVALIFALGILSLMLVMGVAFLGNALISQKIAFNSQEDSSAKLLGRSVADRALAHLMMFHLIQSKYALWDDYKKSDASSVYSKKTGSGNDMLTGDGSKLNVEKKLNKPWYAGKNSSAKWIYVHEDGTESNGAGGTGITSPIIGRFAYQVLPAGLRIPLYAVTSGATKSASLSPKEKAPTGYEFRIPANFRWGIDIDELTIPRSSAADDLFQTCWTEKGYSAQHEYENFIGLLSGGGDATPFGTARKAGDVENLKRWLKACFTEGRERLAPEAYTDNTTATKGSRSWYPRFNLCEFDGDDVWYSRFLAKNETTSIADMKNNNKQFTPSFKPGSPSLSVPDKILDRLTMPPREAYESKHLTDGSYTYPIGLPFLRRIGDNDEKGAFETVANLRKQIAANLNDYCDADSIPTSDVAASTWGGLINQPDTTKLPSYTGNEKTLCINEVAFGFRLHKSKFQIEGGKCIFKPFISSDASKTNKLRAELIVELVEPYRGLPESYDTMRLEGRLNSLKLSLKVSIKGKVKVRRAGEDSDAEVDLEDGIETTKEATLSTPRPFTINKQGVGSANYEGKFGFRKTGRYWVGRATLNEHADPCDVDLTDAIKAKDGQGKNITVTNIENVSHIKVEVVKVSFELANLALFLKDTASSPTVNNFVDFVRVTPGERVTEPASPFKVFAPPCGGGGADGWLEMSNLTAETAKTSGKCYFYGGSMQAIDPRQNLFAKLENNKDNDWVNTFTPTLADVTGGAPDWDSLDNRKTGEKNVNSDPSAPKYATGEAIPDTARDPETATDPAWLDDAAGKHISTAVIRNKPMRSPWELGFIHRGIPFQTINLKGAGGYGDAANLPNDAHKPANFVDWAASTGTRYVNGDAGILDQIKMTEYNRSYGKIDFKDLGDLSSKTNTWWITEGTGLLAENDINRHLFRGLFEGIRRQTPTEFLAESGTNDDKDCRSFVKSGTARPGTAITSTGTPANTPVPGTFIVNGTNITAPKLRSLLLNDVLDKGELKDKIITGDDDAAQEELIGKTINLVESNGYPELPRVFRIVIVAQTIRDQNGVLRSGLDAAGKRKFLASDAEGYNAAAGKFDLDGGVYYDDILSECRMLVTVERVSYYSGTARRARLRIKQIEYLD